MRFTQFEKKMDYPVRKHVRLKDYDYSSPGAYFITICTINRKCLLSSVVGRGLAPAATELTPYGKAAEDELFLLEKQYPFLSVDKYVIMPNHIHAILILNEAVEASTTTFFGVVCEAAGASSRPTLSDIVCAYKSCVTRKCKSISPIDSLFQASFYEHIIRNLDDYNSVVKYTYENPVNWYYDELYSIK